MFEDNFADLTPEAASHMQISQAEPNDDINQVDDDEQFTAELSDLLDKAV